MATEATENEKREYLEGLAKKRGYVLPQYSVLANYDLPVLQALDGITSSIYLAERGLSRGIKELIFVVDFTLQKMPVENIAMHIRMAIDNGIEPLHVLEAIELLVPHAGIPTFSRALEAWQLATGAEGVEFEVPKDAEIVEQTS